MKKLPYSITILLILAGAALTSCGGKVVCEPPPALGQTSIIATPNVPTDVFIDATLSMQGFITDGSLSYYQQSMPMLERAVIRNGGQINFFKFGTDIAELPGRSYGDAERRAFYGDGSINKKTLIEKVLDRANPDSLTIIVTDLFQERADINQLSEKIKNKFIAADRAVGVLAVRSQYSGKIFDVGSNNYSFTYSSGAEPDTLRPFYLLALGRHADIANYFNTLVSGEMAAFPDKHQVIFSQFLAEKISSWAGAKLTDTQGLNEVNGVLVQAQKGDLPYKEFKIKSNASVVRVVAELPFRRLDDVVEFDQLKPSAETFTCGSAKNNTGNETGSKGYAADDGLMEAIKMSAEAPPSGQIKIGLDVDQKRLDQKAICGYHIVLKPERYSLPAWINEWNMTGEQIETWHASPASFGGGKTYNLAPFLQTLWETNRQVHDPKVADFYTFFRVG
jgi:hypothetical protein